MKLMWIIAVVLLPLLSKAETATNTLDTLRMREEAALSKIAADARTAYSNTLCIAMTQLKRDANLDEYLVASEVIKRFNAGEEVSAGLTNSSAAVSISARKIYDEQRRRNNVVLKSYASQLKDLLKQLMVADKIEEAKLAKAELTKVEFIIADLESTLPKSVTPAAATGTVVAKVDTKLAAYPEARVFNGHHYQVVLEKVSWHQAKQACEKMGGHLVIITSEEENEFVGQLIDGKDIWIGCTDEKETGDWRWVNGDKMTFKNWASGQPDNYRGIQHYGMLWHGPTWGDIESPNSALVGYICEWDK